MQRGSLFILSKAEELFELAGGPTGHIYAFISVHLWLNPSVRSSPRKSSTDQELYAAALRALMRRAYSIHEMKEYLTRRAEDKEAIAPLIARLREQNYLDDAKFALNYARQHAQSRRQGRFRIARELRARGVPDRHIAAALDAVFADTDEAALVRKRLERHLTRTRGPLDERKLASVYRSLLRAGFPSDLIRTELRAATRADVPDTSPAPEEEV